MRMLLVLAAALVLAPPASAGDALRVERIRGFDGRAVVRIVVDFAGGEVTFPEVQLLDPGVWRDGTTRLEIPAPVAARVERRRRGVDVDVRATGGRTVVRLAAARHRFKYVAYKVLTGPDTLVILLWKARVPVRGAVVRSDGCLRITSFHGGPGVEMAGRELVPLFEHTVVVRLRRADGKLLAERPLIATNGRWETSFTYSVRRPRRATLEAVSESAKDGALDCLVQVPVLLQPS